MLRYMLRWITGEQVLKTWTLAEARSDFARGLLRGAQIVTIVPGLWTVSITSRLAHDGSGWLVQSKRLDQRQFKSLKAAAEAIENIGFRIKTLVVS